MNDLSARIAVYRRRIRLGRTAAAAVRWAFYASVIACLYLAASKLLGLTVPRAIAATVLAAIPFSMAAREWTRSFTLRDCAIHLDREFGLDERLSTAVERPGAMSGAQAADAAGVLDTLGALPRRVPREAKLLAGSALLFLALLIMPSPTGSGAVDDPALLAAAEEAAARLEKVSAGDPGIARAVELLKQNRIEEATDLLNRLRDRLELTALEKGADSTSAEEARSVAAALGAAAAGLSAELSRAGRTVHAPPPVVAERKLERRASGAGAPTPDPVPADLVRARTSALAHRDWPPRYNDIVLAYFGVER